MSNATDSEGDLPRLTSSSPLPPPITVSSRSLRPRRRGATSSAGSSVSSSRAQSEGQPTTLQSALADDHQDSTQLTERLAAALNTATESAHQVTQSSSQSRKRRSSGASHAGGRKKKRIDECDALEAHVEQAQPIASTSQNAPVSCASPKQKPITSSVVLHNTGLPSTSHNILNAVSDDTTGEQSLRSSGERVSAGNGSPTPDVPDTGSGDPGDGVSALDRCSTPDPLLVAGLSQTTSSSPSGSSDGKNAMIAAGQDRLNHTRPLESVPIEEVEPLAAYTCPICFSPPAYATITPCGHVLCGECLFTAVKTTLQRGAFTLPPGERMTAKCPVCRAPIPGWDGRGGGVIGLRPRAVFSL